MARPKRFNYLNPPIDGSFLPASGEWIDLSELVQLAERDAGVVYEEPPGSNAGPRLAPMWGWPAGPVGIPWAAPYIVWVFGRYFKFIAEEKFDRKVILGITPLRQQFARLGPANTSKKWKGVERYATIDGYDPRWVWFTPESVISGEIPVRAGDLIYFTAQSILKMEDNSNYWSQIYNGTYQGVGHCAICTGTVYTVYNEDLINYTRALEVVHGDWGRIGNVAISVLESDITGRLDTVGFLRYIGPPPDICYIDYNKYA